MAVRLCQDRQLDHYIVGAVSEAHISPVFECAQIGPLNLMPGSSYAGFLYTLAVSTKSVPTKNDHHISYDPNVNKWIAFI